MMGNAAFTDSKIAYLTENEINAIFGHLMQHTYYLESLVGSSGVRTEAQECRELAQTISRMMSAELAERGRR